MTKSTGPQGCPGCQAPQVAPLASGSSWRQALWGRIASREKSQVWFCRHCGERWYGPPAPDEGPGGEDANGTMKLMTVSFANLADSGGLGECPVWDLVALLNGHFSLQVQAIRDQQGHFDKIMGMAVQAFWEAPGGGEDHAALRACRAALAQLRAMETLRTIFPEGPRARLSIGISTGRVLAGYLGPEGARSYSVLGDNVKLSQRLEAGNRIYGTDILISEETCQRAGEAMVSREIDALMVKGRKDPVRIFELLGEKNQVPEAGVLLRDKFLLALEAYKRQEWDRAAGAFQACLDISPTDGPSRLYLERLRDKPPPESGSQERR
jgi:adenylate cyclase